MVATARHLARCVDVYDGDVHAVEMHTIGYPLDVTFLCVAQQCLPS
jgi:hypothetical protein